MIPSLVSMVLGSFLVVWGLGSSLTFCLKVGCDVVVHLSFLVAVPVSMVLTLSLLAGGA